ncbi:MAG: pilus assembly protein [Spirochaetae bacterium HGW-Spirochaetae-5]|nr:MAG: pilus assembly protein [Spirochaetae bacterium HGW-Spirochaetae-5]
MVYCDANIVLRYLLRDNEDHYKISLSIIETEDVFLLNEVTAEIVYVLLKTYSIEKKKVCDVLTKLFLYPNIYFYSKEVILDALDIFSKNSIDYVDCILCAYNNIEKRKIISFDKKVVSFIKKSKGQGKAKVKS